MGKEAKHAINCGGLHYRWAKRMALMEPPRLWKSPPLKVMLTRVRQVDNASKVAEPARNCEIVGINLAFRGPAREMRLKSLSLFRGDVE